MTIKEIVEKYLKENGYDGLLDNDYGCSCTLDDLMPCDPDYKPDCVAAYKRKCTGYDENKCECDGEKNDKGIVESGCMSETKQEQCLEQGEKIGYEKAMGRKGIDFLGVDLVKELKDKILEQGKQSTIKQVRELVGSEDHTDITEYRIWLLKQIDEIGGTK